jgi:AcrR family transcriptional regulator
VLRNSLVTRSDHAARPSARGAESRTSLVEAAKAVLREEGFAAATARNIAARAGCNQALVFYYFGTVPDLLLAALDDVSRSRRERYEGLLEAASSAEELVDLATAVFREDLDSGDAALLVGMIAGSVSTPGLGEAVKERVEPWRSFASRALETAFGGTALGQVVDPAVVAHAVVALYLGLELLADLDGERTEALRLFEAAHSLAPILGLLGGLGASPLLPPTQEQSAS